MDKRSLSILEKAYSAEIDGALRGHSGIFQTRSRLAKKLETDGYLVKVSHVISGSMPVTVEGYRLTLLGNATYCYLSSD